ncbi:hypothetical protein WN51_03636 [Melipona quadrifasciata]|uniref:Uncharacterized protein n=1 Tax=Melipona quadrifasciata TaxID=166423 RepID=A0A0M8ZV85_9HYME|nr:hypothetical protein WN51_03636 [Melipona quadrifasciata]
MFHGVCFLTAIRVPFPLVFPIILNPGREKFELGFNQVLVQIIMLYDVECLMSSSVLFVVICNSTLEFYNHWLVDVIELDFCFVKSINGVCSGSNIEHFFLHEESMFMSTSILVSMTSEESELALVGVQIFLTPPVEKKRIIRKLNRTEDNSVKSLGDNPEEQRVRNIEETKTNDRKENKTIDTSSTTTINRTTYKRRKFQTPINDVKRIRPQKTEKKEWITVSSSKKRENKQTKSEDSQPQPTKKRESTMKPSMSPSPPQLPKHPTTTSKGKPQSQSQPVTLPNNNSPRKHTK